VAAPSLLRDGALLRNAIQQRVRDNLATSRALVSRHPACDLLSVEAGWCAILRVPASQSEEAIVLDLLDAEHVLVHPGYFFDMPHEAFLIVSLLPEPERFADAFARVLRYLPS
jgi:aspartate/methionine/tyrosine aminotransferase